MSATRDGEPKLIFRPVLESDHTDHNLSAHALAPTRETVGSPSVSSPKIDLDPIKPGWPGVGPAKRSVLNR